MRRLRYRCFLKNQPINRQDAFFVSDELGEDRSEVMIVAVSIDLIARDVLKRDLAYAVLGQCADFRRLRDAVDIRVDPYPQSTPDPVSGRDLSVAVSAHFRRVVRRQGFEPARCSLSRGEHHSHSEKLESAVHSMVRVYIQPEESITVRWTEPRDPFFLTICIEVEIHRHR